MSSGNPQKVSTRLGNHCHTDAIECSEHDTDPYSSAIPVPTNSALENSPSSFFSSVTNFDENISEEQSNRQEFQEVVNKNELHKNEILQQFGNEEITKSEISTSGNLNEINSNISEELSGDSNSMEDEVYSELANSNEDELLSFNPPQQLSNPVFQGVKTNCFVNAVTLPIFHLSTARVIANSKNELWDLFCGKTKGDATLFRKSVGDGKFSNLKEEGCAVEFFEHFVCQLKWPVRKIFQFDHIWKVFCNTCKIVSQANIPYNILRVRDGDTFLSALKSSLYEEACCSKCKTSKHLDYEYIKFETSNTKVLALNMGGQGYANFMDRFELGNNKWILRGGVEFHSVGPHYTAWYRQNEEWVYADDYPSSLKYFRDFKPGAEGILLALYEKIDSVPINESIQAVPDIEEDTLDDSCSIINYSIQYRGSRSISRRKGNTSNFAKTQSYNNQKSRTQNSQEAAIETMKGKKLWPNNINTLDEKGQISGDVDYNYKDSIYFFFRDMNKSKTGRGQGIEGKKAKSSSDDREKWRKDNAKSRRKKDLEQQRSEKEIKNLFEDFKKEKRYTYDHAKAIEKSSEIEEYLEKKPKIICVNINKEWTNKNTKAQYINWNKKLPQSYGTITDSVKKHLLEEGQQITIILLKNEIVKLKKVQEILKIPRRTHEAATSDTKRKKDCSDEETPQKKCRSVEGEITAKMKRPVDNEVFQESLRMPSFNNRTITPDSSSSPINNPINVLTVSYPVESSNLPVLISTQQNYPSPIESNTIHELQNRTILGSEPDHRTFPDLDILTINSQGGLDLLEDSPLLPSPQPSEVNTSQDFYD